MSMPGIFVLVICLLVAGCSTVSGAVRGVGEDVKSGTDKVADWIKPNKSEKR